MFLNALKKLKQKKYAKLHLLIVSGFSYFIQISDFQY